MSLRQPVRLRDARENRAQRVSEAARGLDPAVRVQDNVNTFKRFLRENVDTKSTRRRPVTAGVTAHSHQWAAEDLRAHVHGHCGIGTATWTSTLRDIDSFAGLHDPSAKQKQGAAMAAAHTKKPAGPPPPTRKKERPAALTEMSSGVPSDAKVMRYLLAYEAFRLAATSRSRYEMRTIFTHLASPDGLDVDARGGAEVRVIRKRTFQDRAAAVLPPRMINGQMKQPTTTTDFDGIYDAFDVFHEGHIFHRPFVAAVTLLDTKSSESLIALVFTCLSTHGAAYHIAEHHAVLQYMFGSVAPRSAASTLTVSSTVPLTRMSMSRPSTAASSATSVVTRWALQRDPLVVEFLSLGDFVFGRDGKPPTDPLTPSSIDIPRAANGAIAWKDLRLCVTEKYPALSELIVQNLL